MMDSNVVELHPFKCAKLEAARGAKKCQKQCPSCKLWWPTNGEATDEADPDR